MKSLSRAGRASIVIFLSVILTISMWIPSYFGLDGGVKAAAGIPDTTVILGDLPYGIESGNGFNVSKSWLNSDGKNVTDEVNKIDNAVVIISVPFYIEIDLSDKTDEEKSNIESMLTSGYKINDNVTASFIINGTVQTVVYAYGTLNITLDKSNTNANNDGWELTVNDLAGKFYAYYIILYESVEIPVDSGNTEVFQYNETTNVNIKSKIHTASMDNNAATLNVTNTIKTKDITAQKVWENMDGTENTDTHPTTYFRLYRSVNGGEPEPVESVGLRELKDGETTVSWDDMFVEDNNGNPYTYSVKEVDSEGNPAVPDGYIKKEDGLTVTNVKIPLNDITANKVWTNLDGTIDMSDHPTICFKLYRNIEGGEPEAVEDADLIELTNGTTTATWENMPYCDDQGNPYTYSVRETDELGQDGVPVNYTKLEDGLTVTNTKTTVDIPLKDFSDSSGSTDASKKAESARAVETGDPNNIFLTAGICLAAAAALALMIRRRKAK